MGYSLVHLSAYNNIEKCMEVLFHHIIYDYKFYNNNAQDYYASNNDVKKVTSRKVILKEWINQPTMMTADITGSNNPLTSNTPGTYDI